MILATLDTATVTLLGLLVTIELAVLVAIWRGGIILGGMLATLKDHDQQLKRMEIRVDAHARLHRARRDR